MSIAMNIFGVGINTINFCLHAIYSLGYLGSAVETCSDNVFSQVISNPEILFDR